MDKTVISSPEDIFPPLNGIAHHHMTLDLGYFFPPLHNFFFFLLPLEELYSNYVAFNTYAFTLHQHFLEEG